VLFPEAVKPAIQITMSFLAACFAVMKGFRSEPPASTPPANKHGKVDRRTCAEAFSGLLRDRAVWTELALEQTEEACHI
jgi:hypothetical protein